MASAPTETARRRGDGHHYFAVCCAHRLCIPRLFIQRTCDIRHQAVPSPAVARPHATPAGASPADTATSRLTASGCPVAVPDPAVQYSAGRPDQIACGTGMSTCHGEGRKARHASQTEQPGRSVVHALSTGAQTRVSHPHWQRHAYHQYAIEQSSPCRPSHHTGHLTRPGLGDGSARSVAAACRPRPAPGRASPNAVDAGRPRTRPGRQADLACGTTTRRAMQVQGASEANHSMSSRTEG